MVQPIADRATFEIKQWWPTVVFTCRCIPEVAPQVLTISGTMAEAVCPECQTGYKIEHFAYDRQTDSIVIALGERRATSPILTPH